MGKQHTDKTFAQISGEWRFNF